MHKLIKPAALLVLAFAGTAVQASDVNFGVSVAGQVSPGVYGQVNIGNTRPAVVYAQPMVIVPPPRPMQPIYLNVPPGHAKNWRKHCHRYDACGRPVYFVKTAEYGGYDGGHRGDYRDDHRGDYRGDGRGDWDNERHGHGNGKGHGNGHGHGNKHGD